MTIFYFPHLAVIMVDPAQQHKKPRFAFNSS